MKHFFDESAAGSPQLRLAKQRLEEIFQSGYPKAIKAITGTLEVFARESRAWAEEREERRTKLTVIRAYPRCEHE